MFLVLTLASVAIALVKGTNFAVAGTTFAPTRLDDPTPDGCQPADCSLREAIIASNDNPGPDTITLGAGQYDVSLVSSYHGQPVTAPVLISDDTTVVGLGADRTRLHGEGVGGVFEIFDPEYPIAAISVNIADLAIQDGLRDGGGGAVYARTEVSLSISRVSMTGNGCGAGAGGAILSYGATTITDSTIADNWAQDGGGVYGGSLTMTNTTVSHNRGMSGTGGISNTNATLTNVTVTGNSGSVNSPGGLWGSGVTVRNSIIAGNTGSQCAGVTSFGHNQYSDDSCGLGPGDLPPTDPLLGPLRDNGGPTQTHALLAGSPAIDAGDGCPASDQRGYLRVGICDIGAFEFAGTPPIQLQGDTNCDEEATSVDSLFILREVAGLGEGACAENGDVNCDGDRTSVDALGVLRYVAGLPVNQGELCPKIGTPV